MSIRQSHSARLAAALAYMLAQIADGAEFPDAQWRATQRFNVSAADVQTEYDAAETEREEHVHAARSAAYRFGV